jgi:hypothetical protein
VVELEVTAVQLLLLDLRARCTRDLAPEHEMPSCILSCFWLSPSYAVNRGASR